MPDLYIRGEGGSIIPMDLPLAEGIQDRLAKGYLTRVNADGSPWVEPAPQGSDLTSGVPPRPAKTAPKTEWVGYAVRAGGMAPEKAEKLTRSDLMALFAG